jgi:hypothetical protein
LYPECRFYAVILGRQIKAVVDRLFPDPVSPVKDPFKLEVSKGLTNLGKIAGHISKAAEVGPKGSWLWVLSNMQGWPIFL